MARILAIITRLHPESNRPRDLKGAGIIEIDHHRIHPTVYLDTGLTRFDKHPGQKWGHLVRDVPG